MNVGEAARRSRLPAKTLRYYDEIDLIRPRRSASGYRAYSDEDVFRLRFVQRARGLGFSIDDCRVLLSLYDSDERTSREVKAIVATKIETIERKLAELRSIRDTLQTLADRCEGNDRPDCPIIDELAGETDGGALDGSAEGRESSP